MIDNIEFTKFVLAHMKMTEEEKTQLLNAVPKLTEKEKTRIMEQLKIEELANLFDEITEVENQALFAGKNVDEAVDEFLKKRNEATDQNRIEEIRQNLKTVTPPVASSPTQPE